jgi:hypothetical protein
MVEVFERVLNDGFDFINNFATNSQDIRYSARIEEMTAVFRRREASNRGRIANPAPMKAKTRSPEAPAPPKRFEVAWYCGLYRLRRNGKSSLWAKTNLRQRNSWGAFLIPSKTYILSLGSAHLSNRAGATRKQDSPYLFHTDKIPFTL